MSEIKEKSRQVQQDGKRVDISTRREFIENTLKITAGIYASMTVVEQFTGPLMGKGGMPLHAASGRRTITDYSDRPHGRGEKDRRHD